jgi:hypothetical protein
MGSDRGRRQAALAANLFGGAQCESDRGRRREIPHAAL